MTVCFQWSINLNSKCWCKDVWRKRRGEINKSDWEGKGARRTSYQSLSDSIIYKIKLTFMATEKGKEKKSSRLSIKLKSASQKSSANKSSI